MTNKKRILVVDDDVEFVDANRALLEAHGYEVKTAHDGPTALAMARSERPDLLLLDVMMKSDTEGFEVSRAVAESEDLAGLPIILLTGIRRAMNLPFKFEPDNEMLPVKALLEKPIAPEQLLAEVEKHLG